MNIKNMSVEQLKQQFPDVYNQGFNQGIKQERKRSLEWINSGLSKWEIRDGIKSNLTLANYKTKELNDFYGSVDAKLKGNGITPNNTKAQETKNNHFTQLECKEFYNEVDSMLQSN